MVVHVLAVPEMEVGLGAACWPTSHVSFFFFLVLAGVHDSPAPVLRSRTAIIWALVGVGGCLCVWGVGRLGWYAWGDDD